MSFIIKNAKMTEKQGFPSGHENNEYILGNLYDETPPSSSEDSVNRQKLPPICSENALLNVCPEKPIDNLEAFEEDCINRITTIRTEVELIKTQILSLDTEELERDIKKYEEVLIQKTLSLDNIATKGIDHVKELRKETILFVQDCLKLLDVKAKETVINQESLLHDLP